MRLRSAFWAVAAAAVLGGCEPVHGGAIGVGPRAPVPSGGAIYVHTVTTAPEGVQFRGEVFAWGADGSANVTEVMSELVRQAQELGGKYLVVDDVHMEYRTYGFFDPYAYPYGYGCAFGPCWGAYGWGWYGPGYYNIETSRLVARGRVFGPPSSTAPPGAGRGATGGAP